MDLLNLIDLLNPIFIPIALFGLITSYTDIRFGKVKNIVVILMLLSGLFINIFFTNLLSHVSLDLKSDFMQTITNFFLALGFGFFLWLANLWSEGDAKLFLGYSLLLPVFTYKHGYIMFFPALNILINTFIPIAFFFIAASLVKMNARLLKRYAEKTLEKNSLLNTALTTFVLSFLIGLFFQYIKIQTTILFNLIIIFILLEVMKRIKFLSSRKILLFVSLLIIIFYFNSIATIQFVERFLIMIIFVNAFTILLPYSIEHSLVESVNIENLKEGMILSEPVDIQPKEEPKKITAVYSLFKAMKENFSLGVLTRLTSEDIKMMKRLQKSGKLDCKTVKVAKTVPFAPFMFLGVLLTYILQGSLFSYLPL